jgi:hypothetical protein
VIEAIEKITAKTSRQRLEPNFLNTLVIDRSSFARAYVAALDRFNNRDGDKLHVFEAVARLIDIDVVLPDPIKTGVEALKAWWGDVESRKYVDRAACSILVKQLRRLDKMQRQLSNDKTINPKILEGLSKTSKDLGHRGAQLSLQ